MPEEMQSVWPTRCVMPLPQEETLLLVLLDADKTPTRPHGYDTEHPCHTPVFAEQDYTAPFHPDAERPP